MISKQTNPSQTITQEPEKNISHLSVNLLPAEVILKRQQNLKLTFSTKLSIITLVVTIFFTSATLTLRLFQNFELNKAQENVVHAEKMVEGLKTKEEGIILLKNRLTSIQNLMGGDIKRKAIFNLVVFLTPKGMQISEVIVDKSGKMAITLSSLTLINIEELISDLGNREKNANLISKVDLDGLSVGKDTTYRFTLKITPRDTDKTN